MRKAQVGSPELTQLAADTQPGQRQRRINPRQDHQAQVWRQMFEQVGQLLVDHERLDQVIIIQHQHERILKQDQLVYQRIQNACDRWRCVRLQRIDQLVKDLKPFL